jgi:branched-chain amino acid transport system permease protein
MALWVIQSLNSLALGGLLFLLSVGFSLIFGLMRVANLTHGAYFMLGAYLGLSTLNFGFGFWTAVVIGGLGVGLLGVVVERLLLRRLAGKPLPQVLVTLGLGFIIADACLAIWSGDPVSLPTPEALSGATELFGFYFPTYRLAVIGIAVGVAIALWFLLEKTRIGSMIRAGVDDMQMARAMGIPVSRLFSGVFFLGCALAGMGGVLGGPILSVYPGLDVEMLPLALLVVILGGVGSLGGAFLGAFVIGFTYTFGLTLVPDLAYIVLFLPMVIILIVRPRGLLGRHTI